MKKMRFLAMIMMAIMIAMVPATAIRASAATPKITTEVKKERANAELAFYKKAARELGYTFKVTETKPNNEKGEYCIKCKLENENGLISLIVRCDKKGDTYATISRKAYVSTPYRSRSSTVADLKGTAVFNPIKNATDKAGRLANNAAVGGWNTYQYWSSGLGRSVVAVWKGNERWSFSVEAIAVGQNIYRATIHGQNYKSSSCDFLNKLFRKWPWPVK